MKYYFQRKVAYQHVDMSRKLRLYTLENYLLEIAGEVADQMGFGIKQLYPRNLTWILTHLNLEIDYLPTHEEQLEFETWIETNAHMLSVRDFKIYRIIEGGEKELIGRAKSVWAVLDLTSRAIVNVFDDAMFEGAIDGEVLDMDRAPKLLPMDRLKATMPDAVYGEAEQQVRYSDMDYNGHCNSCKYLEMMINAAIPVLQVPLRLDINYQKEIGLGAHVRVLYAVTEHETQYRIVDEEGHTSAAARIATKG